MLLTTGYSGPICICSAAREPILYKSAHYKGMRGKVSKMYSYIQNVQFQKNTPAVQTFKPPGIMLSRFSF